MSQQLKAGWILFSLGIGSGLASYLCPIDGIWIFGPFQTFFLISIIIGSIALIKEGNGQGLIMIIVSTIALSAVNIGCMHATGKDIQDQLDKSTRHMKEALQKPWGP